MHLLIDLWLGKASWNRLKRGRMFLPKIALRVLRMMQSESSRNLCWCGLGLFQRTPLSMLLTGLLKLVLQNFLKRLTDLAGPGRCCEFTNLLPRSLVGHCHDDDRRLRRLLSSLTGGLASIADHRNGDWDDKGVLLCWLKVKLKISKYVREACHGHDTSWWCCHDHSRGFSENHYFL